MRSKAEDRAFLKVPRGEPWWQRAARRYKRWIEGVDASWAGAVG